MNDLVGIYGLAENRRVRGMSPYMQSRSRQKYVAHDLARLSDVQVGFWLELTTHLPIPLVIAMDKDKR